MKVKNVCDVKPNEFFIWADDYTRDYMCVHQDEDRLNVLVCKTVEHGGRDPRIFVRSLTVKGWNEILYYDNKCRVIIVDQPYQFMRPAVVCSRCELPFSNHHMGMDARTDGIKCNDGGIFVPDESSLYVWHTEEMCVRQDFFASIGL